MRILFTVTIAILAANPVVAADFPKFKAQEIDSGLKIGYAVIVVDIDGDKKPDIVVVDQHQIVWYQNPGKPGMDWKKRIILDGKTKPDNVCIAAIDIDGDGLPELVIGSAWKPFDTGTAAQLGWVKRGKTLDEEWTYYPLPCDEPTVHRVRVADIDGDGKLSIILAPLMGRDSTKEKNWMDGRPVRIVAYKVPAKDPEKPGSWKPTVISEELHVVHNIWPYPFSRLGEKISKGGVEILAASYEGVSLISQVRSGEDQPRKWDTARLVEANQTDPKGNRGASEVKGGIFGKDYLGFATIEPWHGNQVVVYSASDSYKRHVIDEQLRWGHAVSFADLDGDGAPELIVGVRDDPNPKMGDTFKERRGVRIYKNTDRKGQKWERFILEDGGVAVEDLTVADLDGDGKPDIIAVGRATGNARIYWNQGK